MLHGDENGLPYKDWAWEAWSDRYGAKPPWGKIEFVSLATALERFEDEATARAAWRKFLASDESFTAGHSPRLFLASLGRWMPKPKPKRERRDSITEDPQYAERTKALIQISREVAVDASIPADQKRSETSRRFRERFP